MFTYFPLTFLTPGSFFLTERECGILLLKMWDFYFIPVSSLHVNQISKLYQYVCARNHMYGLSQELFYFDLGMFLIFFKITRLKLAFIFVYSA